MRCRRGGHHRAVVAAAAAASAVVVVNLTGAFGDRALRLIRLWGVVVPADVRRWLRRRLNR